jgi:hypothetical protein
MEHSKSLFGFVAVLGAASVTIFFAGFYSYSIGLENILASLPNTQLGFYFVSFCLLGGTVFLTAGTVGIGRQYLKNSKNPVTRRRANSFTILAVISILSVVFGLFSCSWMGALTVPGINQHPVENTVVLDVSVNNADPLILTVNMKSLYRYADNADSTGFMMTVNAQRDIEFDRGYVQDDNQTVVAECPRTVPFGSVSDGRGHSVQHFIVCLLPANSSKTVTLNFDTALPSGDYCLTLSTHGYPFCSDYFTIP